MLRHRPRQGPKVRVGSITHTYDGDLTITLIAPDGRSVKLVSGKGGNGDNFAGTVFADSAASTIRSDRQRAVHGTYKPAEPLSSLDGEPLAGTWTLKVTDGSPGEIGTLDAWGIDVAPAVCAGQPQKTRRRRRRRRPRPCPTTADSTTARATPTAGTAREGARTTTAQPAANNSHRVNNGNDKGKDDGKGEGQRQEADGLNP